MADFQFQLMYLALSFVHKQCLDFEAFSAFHDEIQVSNILSSFRLLYLQEKITSLFWLNYCDAQKLIAFIFHYSINQNYCNIVCCVLWLNFWLRIVFERVVHIGQHPFFIHMDSVSHSYGPYIIIFGYVSICVPTSVYAYLLVNLL